MLCCHPPSSLPSSLETCTSACCPDMSHHVLKRSLKNQDIELASEILTYLRHGSLSTIYWVRKQSQLSQHVASARPDSCLSRKGAQHCLSLRSFGICDTCKRMPSFGLLVGWTPRLFDASEQGCEIKGFIPTSVIQGNLPLFYGGLVFGKLFLLYHGNPGTTVISSAGCGTINGPLKRVSALFFGFFGEA